MIPNTDMVLRICNRAAELAGFPELNIQRLEHPHDATLPAVSLDGFLLWAEAGEGNNGHAHSKLVWHFDAAVDDDEEEDGVGVASISTHETLAEAVKEVLGVHLLNKLDEIEHMAGAA